MIADEQQNQRGHSDFSQHVYSELQIQLMVKSQAEALIYIYTFHFNRIKSDLEVVVVV